jgi:hypothetical protein
VARTLWRETHPLPAGPDNLPADPDNDPTANPTDQVKVNGSRRPGGRRASQKKDSAEGTGRPGVV